jgi:hypothetical protein
LRWCNIKGKHQAGAIGLNENNVAQLSRSRLLAVAGGR